MTVADAIARPLTPIGRWIYKRLWWVEHGFERARASEGAEGDTRLRIFFVLALFGAGFVALGLGATRAALFSPYGHGGELSVPAANARADLTDRNGQALAIDVPRYGLYVDPREMAFPDRVRAALVQALPDLPEDKLARLLAGDHRQYVLGDLTPEQQAAIHDLALPGVSFEEETGRDYPLQSFAAHVIGLSSRDGFGISGAEKAFDNLLRAGAGHTPVALSIDLRVQGALEDELSHAAAAFQPDDAVGMVVNVRTGEILAMASWPTFNPNTAGAFDRNTMTNHAAATVYEPGSVMKVFTVAMGLDAGVATPDKVFDVTPLVVGDQTIHDLEHGPSTLTLREVFTHSSNIGAARLGLMAGPEVMDRYFRSFGLFDAAPSELVESARPLTPARLTQNAVASMSFGHAIAVSPLALATGMSAILNGGVYRPLTLKRLDPGQPPVAGRRVIQEQTSLTMLGLMRQNVVEGTGTQADEIGLRVGGKTGTATKLVNGHYVQGKNAANLASFAAIFPTDAPFTADRYLVLIMLDAPKANAADHGVTTAAFTAAPTAGHVIDRIAPFVGVRRVITASDLTPKPPPTAATSGANEQ